MIFFKRLRAYFGIEPVRALGSTEQATYNHKKKLPPEVNTISLKFFMPSVFPESKSTMPLAL
jgi:hypothetical protein